MSYPKWLYHPSKAAVIVADLDAQKALGLGWVESPAFIGAEPPKVAKPVQEDLTATAKTPVAQAEALISESKSEPKHEKPAKKVK